MLRKIKKFLALSGEEKKLLIQVWGREYPDIQKIFTDYGCNIRTRLGMHEVNAGNCSIAGLIILETIGSEEQIIGLINALNRMDGIEVQKMTFGHE